VSIVEERRSEAREANANCPHLHTESFAAEPDVGQSGGVFCADCGADLTEDTLRAWEDEYGYRAAARWF
jgi:hypothetical protein